MNKCKDCACWQAGVCRRHPPQMVWTSGMIFSAWPVTKPDEGCFDFIADTACAPTPILKRDNHERTRTKAAL
jgi:hypothetical protein